MSPAKSIVSAPMNTSIPRTALLISGVRSGSPQGRPSPPSSGGGGGSSRPISASSSSTTAAVPSTAGGDAGVIEPLSPERDHEDRDNDHRRDPAHQDQRHFPVLDSEGGGGPPSPPPPPPPCPPAGRAPQAPRP